LSTDHINEKEKIIFIISDSSNDEEFILIKEFEIQFQFFRFFPSDKRDFYASDSSDKEMIQKISDKKIGGDESVNIEEDIKKAIEKNIEEGIEEGIEKGIEEGIKEVVE
jgi:flagellar biosynthesis/type III secretory pathway protein FliH